MSWSVVGEIGIEYAAQPDSAGAQRLSHPVCAGRAGDGTVLIVDEVAAEKPVPFRMECRTIRVDVQGNIVYDTWKHGIRDGYGALAEDGTIAILRRTAWELLLVSPDGTVADRLGLATFSKRIPRTVTWTDHHTFVVVFLDRSGQLDIVELDRQGRMLWYLPSRIDFLGVPLNVQLLPNDTLLLADAFRHVVWELDRHGRVVWQFGEAGNPARDLRHLSGPSSARALADGSRVIADTRNHRLLRVAVDGTSAEVGTCASTLSDPTFVDAGRDGHLLVCDTGNARVVELDPQQEIARQQEIVWQYGPPVRTRRLFSYPRSIETTGPGEYLVADTAHDRVVKIANGRLQEQPFDDDPPLFWPRCVRALTSGSLLIADGRRGRIIEVSAEGRVVNQLSKVKLDGGQLLQDPHDVRMLPSGHLLITDSPLDAVFEVNWSGHVHRMIGSRDTVELDDPHSAQQLADGTLVICDTGAHRVLFVDEQGACVRCIETIDAGAHVLRLNRPRYLEVGPDDTMLIVDTGHNRVLATTTAGRLLWVISDVPESPLPRFNQPRWATLIDRNEVLICDHFHHRIVHLRRAAHD